MAFIQVCGFQSGCQNSITIGKTHEYNHPPIRSGSVGDNDQWQRQVPNQNRRYANVDNAEKRG